MGRVVNQESLNDPTLYVWNPRFDILRLRWSRHVPQCWRSGWKHRPVGRWRVVGPFFGSEWHHQLQHTVRLKDRYGEVQDPRAHVTAFDRKK